MRRRDGLVKDEQKARSLLQSSLNADTMGRLLEQKRYLVSEDAFGSDKPGWFRIVFAQPRELDLEVMRRTLRAVEGSPIREMYESIDAVSLCVCVQRF